MERKSVKLFEIRTKEFQIIMRNLPSIKDKTVLEVGMGSGIQSKYWSALSNFFVGIDIDLSSLKWKIPNCIKCSALYLPFKANVFDIVFSSNVLEHVKNRELMVSEIERVLKPNGLAITTIPSRIWKLIQMIMYYPHLLFSYILRYGNISTSFIERRVREKPRVLLPPVHGEYKSNLNEFSSYSIEHWAKILESGGLKIHRILKLPVYSPYDFGIKFLGKIGRKLNLCSSYAFVLQKK